jgi:hypothetical protein
MHFTWIGDSYELMRFRRFVFLKHKVCIIKAVRFVMNKNMVIEYITVLEQYPLLWPIRCQFDMDLARTPSPDQYSDPYNLN